MIEQIKQFSNNNLDANYKINGIYKIPGENVLGYYSRGFINFSAWLKKHARDNINNLHRYFSYTFFQYDGNNRFIGFLSDFPMYLRDDSIELDSGILIQRSYFGYSFEEVSKENLGKIFADEDRTRYYQNNFNLFAQMAFCNKNKIKPASEEVLYKINSDTQRGEELVLRHNKINGKY